LIGAWLSLTAGFLFFANPCSGQDWPSVATSCANDPFLAEFEAELAEPGAFPDPLEPLNRTTLQFNEIVDLLILDPVTHVYRFVVPDPGRRAIRRFMDNLNSPVVLLNDLLQCDWKDAGVTFSRFVVNTTVGIAGLFDPARDRLALERHESDFGQTLALAGLPSGPYLVLPVVGPTTARDGLGSIIGFLCRPTTYLLGPVDLLVYNSIYDGSAGLVTREKHADSVQILEDSSIDYYAALRGAYYQSRMAQIYVRDSP
jgi:phospholipid-binding lipoprotein MlaA